MAPVTGLHGEPAKQLRLLEIETERESSPPSNGGSVFNDPAFARNKTLPVHRWVPWIAGFSSDFVQDALNRYLNRKGIVLDPFAGVGTTLVEAALLGHNVVGFEINPYAALACRTKLNAYQIAVAELYDETLRFKSFYNERISSGAVPKSAPPKGFKTRAEFYSPQVLRKVLILQDFIDTVEDFSLRDLFRLAFASTMVRYSNYSYEPSLGRRASAGKEDIQDFPVAQTVLSKLAEMAESIGLELVRIDVPRATRVGNSIIQSDVRVAKAQDSHQLYEAVVELRKSKSTVNRIHQISSPLFAPRLRVRN